jgi:hypothetical protein
MSKDSSPAVVHFPCARSNGTRGLTVIPSRFASGSGAELDPVRHREWTKSITVVSHNARALSLYAMPPQRCS